ncbi:MAG: PKD domain-containing protein [Gemmatimonadetes bacterium]|nr:MAG: PKD domain-containing protein [Gemmatimonadota bacterium]
MMDKNRYEQEIEDLRREIDSLNRVLREKSAYEDRLQTKNKRLMERNNQLFKQVAELQGDVARLHQQVFALNKSPESYQTAVLQAELDQLQSVVNELQSRETSLLAENQRLKTDLNHWRSATAQDSHETVRKTAEIEQLKRARQEAEERLSRKTAEFLELSERIGELDRIYEKTIAEVKRLREQLTATKAENQDKTARLAKLHAEQEDLQAQLVSQQSRAAEMQAQLAETRSKLNLAEKNIQQLTETLQKYEHHQIPVLRSQLDDLNRQISEKDKEINILRKKNEALGSATSGAEASADDDDTRHRELQQEVERLNNVISQKERELEILAQDKQKLVDQQLHFQQSLQAELAAKIELEFQQRELNTKLAAAQQEIETLRAELAARPELATGTDGLETDLQNLQALLEERDATIASLNAQLSEMADPLVAAKAESLQQELDTARRKISDLRTENSSLQQQLNDLKTALEHRHSIEAEITSLSATIDRLNQSLEASAAEKADLKRAYDSLRHEWATLYERLNQPEPVSSKKKYPAFWLWSVFFLLLAVLLLFLPETLDQTKSVFPLSNPPVITRLGAPDSMTSNVTPAPPVPSADSTTVIAEMPPESSSPAAITPGITPASDSTTVIAEMPPESSSPAAITPPASAPESGTVGAEPAPETAPRMTVEPETTPVAGTPASASSPTFTLPATVDLSVDVSGGEAPLKTTFHAPLPEPTPDNLNFLWDFGDGVTSRQASPTHTYVQPGIYTTRLNLQYGQDSKTVGQVTIQVDAPPPPPIAEASLGEGDANQGKLKTAPLATPTPKPRLQVSTTEGRAPLEVRFSLSGLEGMPHLSYLWDFGDGSTSSTQANPTHIYQMAGNYRAVGVVKQGNQIVAEVSQTIRVVPDQRNVRIQQLHAIEEMVLIPAGNFHMGDFRGEPDAQPQIIVFLDTYYIDKYEVTNAQYAEFLNRINYTPTDDKFIEISHPDCKIYYDSDQGFKVEPGYEYYPVVCVSWYGADAYAKALNKRLPTEAEWEKAARGEQDVRSYPWGNQWIPNIANTRELSLGSGPTKVGRFPAGESPYGVVDLIGNVSEWCADWYQEDFYQRHSGKNPAGPVSGTMRVYRGGSYSDLGAHARVFDRAAASPDAKHPTRGFRCAR